MKYLLATCSLVLLAATVTTGGCSTDSDRLLEQSTDLATGLDNGTVS